MSEDPAAYDGTSLDWVEDASRTYGSSNPIQIRRDVLAACGGDFPLAIMVTRIVFFSLEAWHDPERSGWVYNSHKDWERWCGLTRNQVDRCNKVISSGTLPIEITRRQRWTGSTNANGNPHAAPVNHYRVTPAFSDWIGSIAWKPQNRPEPESIQSGSGRNPRILPQQESKVQETLQETARDVAANAADGPPTEKEPDLTTHSGIDVDAEDDEVVKKITKPTPHEMVTAYCSAVQQPMPSHKGKAYGVARKLIAAGLTPGEVPALVAWIRRQSWASEKGFDIGTLAAVYDRWRNAEADPAPSVDRALVGALLGEYGKRLETAGVHPNETIGRAAADAIRGVLTEHPDITPEAFGKALRWKARKDGDVPRPERLRYVWPDWCAAGQPDPDRTNAYSNSGRN